MLRARGEYIIFADADGASTFADIQLLEEQMRTIRNADGYGVVVGSRAHLVETDAVVQRSLVRNLLMYAFHAYVHLLGIKSIKDTQCGFKLFSRKAAARVFPNVHVDGWIFDIELFVIVEKCNIPVAEVPIRWEEVDGSKMSLMRDAITMALDLLIIRLNYWLGIWTIGKVKRKR
jgi:dolichyl-phosphate beta-glucosyltransferase